MAIDWDAELLTAVMAEFGEGVPVDQSSWPLYTPRGLPAFRIADAVFDRAYAEISLDADVSETTNRKPCLGVRVSLFPPNAPAQSDLVFIPSVGMTFVVKDVQADGHGHAKLILMDTGQ